MARLFASASSQYLSLASAVRTAAPLTMSCWFNTSDNTNFQVLMALVNTTTTANFFRLSLRGDVAADPVEFTINSGTATPRTSTTYSINAWNHACAVETSTASHAVYLNGGGVGTSTGSQTPTGLVGTQIGRYQNGATPAGYFSGSIAEAAIWSVALTADEVLELAAAVSPRRVRPASLVAHWPIFGINSPETNGLSTGDMTVNAAPVYSDHPRMFRTPRVKRFVDVPAYYSVASAQGSFTETGQTAELKRALKLSADLGSYT